jgi:hypothetical protein
MFDNISNNILILHDFPTEMLKKGKLNEMILPTNSLFIGCRSNKDMKVDTEFDTLFSYKNVEKYIITKAILKYVSVNPSYEIDYLPYGYYGICLIDFPEGIPLMLNKLNSENMVNYDLLFLTKKTILDETLKLYNELDIIENKNN